VTGAYAGPYPLRRGTRLAVSLPLGRYIKRHALMPLQRGDARFLGEMYIGGVSRGRKDGAGGAV
jgi:hypothetical protein